VGSFTPSISLVSDDARGKIYAINLPGDRELMLLYSVKGTLRGGHSHNVPEIVMLLDGSMRYRKLRVGTSDHVEVLQGGDTSFNEAGEVHVGEFLEDSWVLEWKIGTKKGAWSNWNYGPWREQVEAKTHASA